MVSMVLIAPRSPKKGLLIDASYILRQLILTEISGRSVGNHYGTYHKRSLTIL